MEILYLQRNTEIQSEIFKVCGLWPTMNDILQRNDVSCRHDAQLFDFIISYRLPIFDSKFSAEWISVRDNMNWY